MLRRLRLLAMTQLKFLAMTLISHKYYKIREETIKYGELLKGIRSTTQKLDQSLGQGVFNEGGGGFKT